jgi:hypothetical protein
VGEFIDGFAAFEFGGIIDDELDAQYAGSFIVHLESESAEVQFKDREIMHRMVQDFLDAPARASVLMRPVFTAEDGFKSGNIQQVASSID